jgi:hypothetical protein
VAAGAIGGGLLRQYFPEATDLSGYSQKDLDAIALRLNTRPRKTLGYRTPAVTLRKLLHRPVESAPLSRGIPVGSTLPPL